MVIELALSNPETAEEIRRQLASSADVTVNLVDARSADASQACVLVVDSVSIRQMRRPFTHPEKMVLIARDEPGLITSAWDDGVNSVVFDRDPLSTKVLAILSACLRQARPQGTRS